MSTPAIRKLFKGHGLDYGRWLREWTFLKAIELLDDDGAFAHLPGLDRPPRDRAPPPPPTGPGQ